MEDFERLIEDAEELEAIREYDAAKAEEDEVVPAEQVFRKLREPAD